MDGCAASQLQIRKLSPACQLAVTGSTKSRVRSTTTQPGKRVFYTFHSILRAMEVICWKTFRPLISCPGLRDVNFLDVFAFWRPYNTPPTAPRSDSTPRTLTTPKFTIVCKIILTCVSKLVALLLQIYCFV